MADDDEGVADWIEDGGWALLIIGMLVAFWGLAVVCEDFFVPALNVMCETLKIPDDVAGATFMAAGASSPEMFAAFVSLFITHSALGAGTIIGSEIFNHLIICAAAVFYAQGDSLQLDWRLVSREAGFYLLALLLLLYALSSTSANNQPCRNDLYAYYKEENGFMFNHTTNEWKDPAYQDTYCIYWYQSFVLLIGYAAYAVTCAFYRKIMAAFCPAGPKEEDPAAEKAEAFDNGDVSRESLEPSSNFRQQEKSELPTGVAQVGTGALLVAAFAPSHLRGKILTDMEDTEGDAEKDTTFGCYLFKRSRYYRMYSASSNAWRLRWCEFSAEYGLRSFHDRVQKNKVHRYDLSRAQLVVTDRARLLFTLVFPTGKLLMQAPNSKVLTDLELFFVRMTPEFAKTDKEHTVVSPMTAGDSETKTTKDGDQAAGPSDVDAAEQTLDLVEDDEDHHSLIDWPKQGDPLGLITHLILMPFKYMIYYSIPDVRDGGNSDSKYKSSIAMCFLWLVGLSYIMASCVELLADLVGVSAIVAGMTVSAAGTSFPNVFASMIVARQGLGNMAVSNALGGNVFNIFMGLGLPWFLFCFFGNVEVDPHRFMYYGMASGGIVFPAIILIALIVGFMLLLFFQGFRLYKRDGYVFIFLYVCFLVWVIDGIPSPPGLE